jgi:excisionase family DNA binding protein
MNDLGRRLRYLRTVHDPPLTQAQVCERMGWAVSRVTDLSTWENGRRSPSADNLTLYLKAVNSTLAAMEALELPEVENGAEDVMFFPVTEAARRLGVSVFIMRNLAKQGHIEYRSIGQSMLFDLPALEAFLIESRGKHFSSNRMTPQARAVLKKRTKK